MAFGGKVRGNDERTIPPAPATAPPSSGGGLTAFIDQGSEFEGKLSFKDTVRIDGHFTGEITSENTLVVGETGEIEANIAKIEKAMGVASSVKIIPTEDNALIVGLFGKAKRYVEVEDNLFREQNSGISLVPGISPRLLAFQENDQGEITGFVMDGLPFMMTALELFSTSS